MKRFAPFTSLAFMALAASALAAAPRLATGPASLVSAPPIYAPASGAQRIGTLVPTNDRWIAFWSDDVDHYGGTYVSRRRLMATRLAPDGTVLDPTGLRVATEQGYARYDAVATADGARLFWTVPGESGLELRTATVFDDGEVSPPVVVGAYPADGTGASLDAAASGGRVAVMLGRYVMILDGGTNLIRTVDLGGYGDRQSITLALSRFVVTWVAAGDVLMRQTLSLDGDTIGPAGGTGVASPGRFYALSSDGTNALIAWSDAAGLHIGAVDDIGTGRVVETALVPAAWVSPHAVWNGSSYLVAWYSNEDGTIRGVRVQSGGHLLTTEPFRVHDGLPSFFELAANGSETALFYQVGGCIRFYCESDAVVAMLGPTGTGEHLISAAAREQGEPAVASDGVGFLACWREAGQLFAAETSASSRTPAKPFLLSDAPGFSATVAGDGSAYMASWMTYREGRYFVEGTALSRDGSVFTRRPFALQAPGDVFPSSVSIGGADGMFLVAWPRGQVKEAVRVDATGTVLDTLPLTLPNDHYVYMPLSIAFDGDEFVVAWFSVDTTADPRVARVETARVTRGGTPRFDRTWVTVPDGTIQGTAVGCDSNGTCLIVWIEQASPGEHRWSLRGQRFRTGGSLVDSSPFEIDVADRTQTRPNVSWDGTRFVVVWNKYPGDVTPERIEARVIPANGAVALAPPDILHERDIAVHPSATACNSQGRCILAGPEFVDDDVLGRTSRMVKRFFGEVRHRGARR